MRRTLDHKLCLSVKRLYVTGCGALYRMGPRSPRSSGSKTLAGRPTEPMSALQFARYAAGYLPPTGPGTNLVIGSSGPGGGRTHDRGAPAGQAGGRPTLALTATPGSRMAEAAELVVLSTTPPFPDPPGVSTVCASDPTLRISSACS